MLYGIFAKKLCFSNYAADGLFFSSNVRHRLTKSLNYLDHCEGSDKD